MSIVDISTIQLRGTRLDVSNFVFNGPMKQSFKGGVRSGYGQASQAFLPIFIQTTELECLQSKKSHPKL